MTRPAYETLEDLKREWEIAHLVGEHWDFTAKKLPRRYTLDYCMVRGKPGARHHEVVGGLEVKVRKKKYPTLILGQTKMYGAQLYLNMEPPRKSFIVVEWPDGIHFREMVLDAETRLSWGGRQDRGDWQDLEPLIHWPTSSFTLLAPHGSMPETPVDYAFIEKVWRDGRPRAHP